MEEGELFIVAASWGALGGRPRSDLNPKVGKCMEKLLNVLGHDLAFDFKTVSERIAFRSSGYHSAIDVATFETVISAVLSQHELTFNYRKLTPVPMAPSLDPPPDWSSRAAWSVSITPLVHPGRRPRAPRRSAPHLRPLQDERMSPTPAASSNPGKPFDLEALLRDSLGIHRGGPRKTVELLFDPEVAGYVQEHFWHSTEQFGIADDGRLLLTMTRGDQSGTGRQDPEMDAKCRGDRSS
jgi:hypothetical protein